jgi:hypothetical protein
LDNAASASNNDTQLNVIECKTMPTPKPKGSYVHFPAPMKSYFLSILAILASAVPGSLLAWMIISSFDFTGVWLALATVFLAMVFSVLIFAGLVALGRLIKFTKAKK